MLITNLKELQSCREFQTTASINLVRTADINEHSEQARAPHTNGPRDVPRCGALSSSSNRRRTTGGDDGGAQAIVRGGHCSRRRSLRVAGTSSLRPGRFPRRSSLCIAGE